MKKIKFMYRLVIDIGNTHSKMAVFKERMLVQKKSLKPKSLREGIKNILKKYPVQNAIVVCVTKEEQIFSFLKQQVGEVIFLSSKTALPFENLYQSKETLGGDRMALISAAAMLYPQKNVLVIDAGTCITYDFKDEKEAYLGGAISLGLQMRYNALSDQTARLPRLSAVDKIDFIGDSTEKAIHSGVVGGMIFEMRQMIDCYKSHYKEIIVVLTGGDMNYLAVLLKKTIFARPNFLMEGLLYILEHNTVLDE